MDVVLVGVTLCCTVPTGFMIRPDCEVEREDCGVVILPLVGVTVFIVPEGFVFAEVLPGVFRPIMLELDSTDDEDVVDDSEAVEDG